MQKSVYYSYKNRSFFQKVVDFLFKYFGVRRYYVKCASETATNVLFQYNGPYSKDFAIQVKVALMKLIEKDYSYLSAIKFIDITIITEGEMEFIRDNYECRIFNI